MFKHRTSDKKERTLVEIVLIVLVLAILMMSFIHSFFKQEEKFTEAAYSRLAQNFSTKVTAVHAQWFMDKQPDNIVLSLPQESQRIYVNRRGWIDTLGNENACANIWKTVIMEPMNFMNSPVSAIEIKSANKTVGRVCRFELATGEYFEYSSENGKVSQILLKNVNP